MLNRSENIFTEVNAFLSEVVSDPKSTKRKSTRANLFFLRENITFSFSIELLRELIAIIKIIDHENELKCLNVTVPKEINTNNCPSLRKFLSDYCKENSTHLVKLVFSAACQFVQRHPDEAFMMLRQLKDTFSIDKYYGKKFEALEIKYLEILLQTQSVLEDKEFFSALSLFAGTAYSLQNSKVALLRTAFHHVSSSSCPNGQFNPTAHYNKVFSLIFSLNTIKIEDLRNQKIVVNANKLPSSPVVYHPGIQAITLNTSTSTSVTLRRPNALGAIWEKFFNELIKSPRELDLVLLMTTVLQAHYREDNANQDFNKKIAGAWFSRLTETYELNQVSYKTFYDFLSSENILPPNSREPLIVNQAIEEAQTTVAAVVEAPVIIEGHKKHLEEHDGLIGTASAHEDNEKKEKVPETPVRNKARQTKPFNHGELSPIQSGEKTQESSTSPQQQNDTGISLADRLFVEKSDGYQDDFGSGAPINRSLFGSDEISKELLVNSEKQKENENELQMLAIHPAILNEEFDDDRFSVVNNMRDNDDDTPIFPPEQSDFANKFIRLLSQPCFV